MHNINRNSNRGDNSFNIDQFQFDRSRKPDDLQQKVINKNGNQHKIKKTWPKIKRLWTLINVNKYRKKKMCNMYRYTIKHYGQSQMVESVNSSCSICGTCQCYILNGHGPVNKVRRTEIDCDSANRSWDICETDTD